MTTRKQRQAARDAAAKKLKKGFWNRGIDINAGRSSTRPENQGLNEREQIAMTQENGKTLWGVNPTEQSIRRRATSRDPFWSRR